MKPSLKKPGDFIVAEGHGHPLVRIECPRLFHNNVPTYMSRYLT
jgi:hypothetical protein